MLAAQLTAMPDAPHRSLPDIPVVLSNVVMRCLEKHASKRFQTAGEMLAALDELPPMVRSGSVVAPRPTRRRWVVPAAAALVLVAAIALANSLGNERDGPQDTAQRTDSPETRDAGDNARTGDARNAVALGDTSMLANIDNDNSRSTALPLVITREESLAIAAGRGCRRRSSE